MRDKSFSCYRSHENFTVVIYADNTGGQSLPQWIGDLGWFAIATDICQTIRGSQIDANDCHLFVTSVIFRVFIFDKFGDSTLGGISG